jgi:hypothetical protein
LPPCPPLRARSSGGRGSAHPRALCSPLLLTYPSLCSPPRPVRASPSVPCFSTLLPSSQASTCSALGRCAFPLSRVARSCRGPCSDRRRARTRSGCWPSTRRRNLCVRPWAEPSPPPPFPALRPSPRLASTPSPTPRYLLRLRRLSQAGSRRLHGRRCAATCGGGRVRGHAATGCARLSRYRRYLPLRALSLPYSSLGSAAPRNAIFACRRCSGRRRPWLDSTEPSPTRPWPPPSAPWPLSGRRPVLRLRQAPSRRELAGGCLPATSSASLL